MDKLIELNAVLRLYHSNFLNLHWNSKGEKFDEAHKRITTEYYELCDKYIDSTAEMVTRFNHNPLNYLGVAELANKASDVLCIVDSNILYSWADIIKYSDKMLGDILKIVEACLLDPEMEKINNAGIKSDLEAMHSEFDLHYRYINKRRML